MTSMPERISREHELDLVRRWQDHDDIQARDELIAAHMSFADMFVARFAKYKVDPEDIRQEACLGLVEACRRKGFDPARGCRWITYATGYVKLQVLPAILAAGPIPLRRTNSRLAFAVSHSWPVVEEDFRALAERYSTTVERVHAVWAAMYQMPDDIDGPHTGDCGPHRARQPMIADDSAPTEDDMIDRIDVQRAWAKLTPRERYVVEHCVQGDPPMTHAAAAVRLRCSARQVRSIEAHAVEVLREALGTQ